jgi:hypothetical protein
MHIKLQNNNNENHVFYFLSVQCEWTDRVRHIVVEVCSNLIGLRTFDEIAACMIEPEDEVVNIFDP